MLALACVGAVTLWTRSDDPPRALAEQQPTPAEPDVSRTPTSAVNPASPASTEPLPPETLALSQRLAELERLAEAGHPEASCQLVVERLRCGFLQRWQPERGNRSRELQLEAQGQLEEANRAAEATLLRIEQKNACGTAPPIESVDSLALLGPAAAAGHAPSAVLYFELGHEFRNERGIFRHPHFDGWRRNAARHLQAAFEAGHPGAARALGRAYLDDGDFANGLVPDDPRRAFLHLQLAALLDGQQGRLVPERSMGLDADERARLKAEAMRLHRDRFGGRTYQGPELSARGPYRQPGFSASDFCNLPRPQ
ncbi:hypothetical protein N788_06825 [Arenimonas donghaensis DSM 18148 = HO3-R19]|uniref:Uncharacterized protein n=1 Tax=Arenimonas donghaensis DSM 18148 = HO3-R19 TaxID=1121014 RepID=A0A087MFU9_9GAMM|nr:hypothetical protein N788_06825 [Arenimonas donghaensis DSM 18148 = HO3-R19]